MVRADHFYRTPAGYRAVMRSAEIQDVCLDYVRTIGTAAEGRGGGPYVYDVIPGQNRAHARAKTASGLAIGRERKYMALSKSVPRKGQWGEKHRENWRKGARKILGY